MIGAEQHECLVFYGDLDDLIVRCVDPILRPVCAEFQTCYWRRHYAGGSHLRIVIKGDPVPVASLMSSLRLHTEQFMRERPSATQTRYSAARAAELLALEGEECDPCLLEYKENVFLESHRTMTRGHVTPAAAALGSDFLRDSMGLAVTIISDRSQRRALVLRLYILYALLLARGTSARGFISFKSHWEGFVSAGGSHAFIELVDAQYQRVEDECLAHVAYVRDALAHDSIGQDEVLSEWKAICERYMKAARRVLAEGHALTRQPRSLEEARRMRETYRARKQRDRRFTERLWKDERFMASVQFDHDFLTARVMTNLLYMLVAAVGLTYLDRMALCHHAYRTAEQAYGCDLTDLLQTEIDIIVARHADKPSV